MVDFWVWNDERTVAVGYDKSGWPVISVRIRDFNKIVKEVKKRKK